MLVKKTLNALVLLIKRWKKVAICRMYKRGSLFTKKIFCIQDPVAKLASAVNIKNVTPAKKPAIQLNFLTFLEQER